MANELHPAGVVVDILPNQENLIERKFAQKDKKESKGKNYVYFKKRNGLEEIDTFL